jgi:hypothetical protein
MHHILKEEIYDFPIGNLEMSAYSIQNGSKFQNGYCGQYMCIIDDLCQERQATEGSTQAKLIQWISTISSNMEGAAVDDKVTDFSSSLILSTTNSSYPRNHGCVSDEAFWRRRHMLVEMYFSPTKDPSLGRHVGFRLLDPLKPGVVLKEYLNFATFIKDFKSNYAAHLQSERLLREPESALEIFQNMDLDLEEEKRDENTTVPKTTDAPETLEATHVADFSDTHRAQWAEFILDHPLPELENYAEDHPDQLEWELNHALRVEWLAERGYPPHLAAFPEDDLVQGSFSWDDGLSYTSEESDDESNFVEPTDHDRNLSAWESMGTDSSISHTIPFFLKDGKEVDNLKFDDPGTAAYLYIMGMVNLDFTLDMQGHRYDLNPYASMAFAKHLLQKHGVAGGVRKRFEDPFTWRLTNSRWFIHPLYTPVFSYPNGKRDVDCPAGDLWTLTPCSGDLQSAAAMYIRWTAFKLFCKKYAKSLLLASVIVPAAILMWQRWTAVRPQYHATGIASPPGSIPLVPCEATISRRAWTCRLKGEKGVGSATFVGGRFFVTAYHVGATFGKEFQIFMNGKEYTEVFNPNNWHRLESSCDLGVYQCTNQAIPESPYILKRSVESNRKTATIDVILANSQKEDINCKAVFCTTTVNVRHPACEDYAMDRSYRYHGKCGPGDSGSPAIIRSTQWLLGLVVASGSGGTFIETLPLDELRAIMKASSDPTVMADFTSHFPLVGKSTTPVHQMKTTKFVPSVMAAFLTMVCFFAPAALTNRDPRLVEPHDDLLVESMKGYDHPFATLDPDLVEEILDEIQVQDDERKPVDVERRVLTFSEALNGVGSLKSFELSTAPGLPWRNYPEAKIPGKRGFVHGETPNRESPIWEEALRTYNYEDPILGYACLKDELRTREKVASGTSRSFIVLPAHYNLLLRQMFGSFITAQHLRAGKESSCVGINPYECWADLHARLIEKGTSWEDFDYTEWDRTLSPDWFVAYAKRVNNWYDDGPENAMKRISLMKQLAFAHVQIGGDVYATQGGNKSGCSITAEVNTDIHQMIMGYAWKVLARQHAPHLGSLHHMHHLNAFLFYGDD